MAHPLKARDIFEEQPFKELPPQVYRDPRQSRISESRPVLHRANNGPWMPPAPSYATTPGLGEFLLTMSKASLFALIFGIMLLGILFFVTGFLVALSTLEPSHPTATQTTWAEMNTPASTTQHGTPFKGVPILGTMARAQTAHVASHAGALTKGIVGKVPAPLQPFASSLQSRQIQATQSAIHRTAEGRPPIFAPPASSPPPVFAPQQPMAAPQPTNPYAGAPAPVQPYYAPPPPPAQPMMAPQPLSQQPVQPMMAPPQQPMQAYPQPGYYQP